VSDYNKIHRWKLVLAAAVTTTELPDLLANTKKGGGQGWGADAS